MIRTKRGSVTTVPANDGTDSDTVSLSVVNKDATTNPIATAKVDHPVHMVTYFDHDKLASSKKRYAPYSNFGTVLLWLIIYEQRSSRCGCSGRYNVLTDA